MADDVIGTAQDLQALGDQASAVGDIITNFFNKVRIGAEAAGVKLSDVSKIMDVLQTNIQAASTSFDVEGATTSISTLQDPLDLLIGSFIKMEQVVDQSRVFQQFSTDSGAAINTVTLNLNALQSVMEKLHIPGAAEIAKLPAGLSANATEAEKLENSFIAASAAAGDMNKIFVEQGGDLKDLSALTSAYSNSIINAADATGLSVHQSMEFANALKIIPGVMDQNIKAGIAGEESTTSLIAAMKIMTGAGRSQADVIKAMNIAYDDLSQSQGKVNDSAQKGAEYLSTIASVSTGLKLRFDDVRMVMESVADQFKFVGNETDAAARVLGRYTDALRETGLTSKASIDIIQGMVKGISDLSMGTKAFLSLRSGGPGGLQGAFQIEQLLRQGKLDEVVQMAERSLKQQFGGRVYTQAEAAQSPEAAAQFMRQRQLLQSGAFGIGKGTNDEQATRLLEALGKGDTLAATKEIKTGQEALTAVAKQGSDIQTRNNNELKVANRFLERNAIASELMAGATIRSLFGSTGANAGGVAGQMAAAQSAGIMGVQNNQRLAMESGKPNQADFTQQLIIMGRQAISSAIQAGKGVATGIGSGAEGIAGTAGDIISSLKGLNREIGSQSGSQQVLARTLGTPMPTHSLPPHMQAGGPGVQTAHAVPGNTAQSPEPLRIRLEITHPEGTTVKKVDNSVQTHNQKSITSTFDN